VTDRELALAARGKLDEMLVALRKTKVGLAGRAGSPGPNWSAALRAAREASGFMSQIAASNPPPQPEPEPPPANRGFAPRTHNSTSRADARFCMKSEFGVVPHAGGFIDQMGITYDEGGRDLGGRSKRIVPELKGADSMDGLEPCDEYVGPTGKRIGGAAGYPAESFLQ
jgi:hypothetical protein